MHTRTRIPETSKIPNPAAKSTKVLDPVGRSWPHPCAKEPHPGQKRNGGYRFTGRLLLVSFLSPPLVVSFLLSLSLFYRFPSLDKREKAGKKERSRRARSPCFYPHVHSSLLSSALRWIEWRTWPGSTLDCGSRARVKVPVSGLRVGGRNPLPSIEFDRRSLDRP